MNQIIPSKNAKRPCYFSQGYLAALLVILAVIFTACQSNQKLNSVLTYTVSKEDFRIIVDCEGELEAKESRTVPAPFIRGQDPKISFLLPEGTRVKKDDIVVELASTEIETQYLNAIDEVEIARAEYVKRDAELNLEKLLLESTIQTTESTVKVSRLQLAKISFEPPNVQEINRLEIARDEVEIEKNRKRLESLEKIQKEERIRLQMKIKQAENQRDTAKRDLDNMTLRAPTDGIIQHEISWSTGQKVQEDDPAYEGMPLVKIPDLSVMQVKMQVGETEAQRIELGDSAVVTIANLNRMAFSGKVSKKDKIAKPIKRGSKIKKVEVTVEIDSSRAELLPGLTAYCQIITDKVDRVVVIPQDGVFNKDSLKVVYVKDKDSFVAQEVAVISQNENFVAVRNDDIDKKRIALREPPFSLIKWPDSLKAASGKTCIDSLAQAPAGDSTQVGQKKQDQRQVLKTSSP
jgi:multidrug efflux pump subunit AcrA (membrane-fusion protein)